MKVTGKKILVVGSGISGIAAADLLLAKGAAVVLYDGNKSLSEEQVKAKLSQTGTIEIILGDPDEAWANQIDSLVLSPGVPADLPFIQELKKAGLPVYGEIELGYTYCQGQILAITGTNGKTTTTALLGEIMKLWRKDVHVVGNIGRPFTSEVLKTSEDSVTVIEVSSFQLETIETLCPDVSAVLNISPDHLNRHHTMENYVEAKFRITENQTAKQSCVLNYEDEVTREFGEKVNASVTWFSSKQTLSKGLYLENDQIIYQDGVSAVRICDTKELHILGIHNYENIMAAAAMAMNAGVPLELIREGILGFHAVPHRIEYVTEKSGVAYYNDSKGTNPDAAIKGISAMNRPTILIGGGYDKDSDYTEWIRSFDGKVKWLVLIGATREKIAKTAEKEGFFNIKFADTLDEAVKLCSEAAKPGDAVLLSPACASWGMFDNYEQRGDRFKELVHGLRE